MGTPLEDALREAAVDAVRTLQKLTKPSQHRSGRAIQMRAAAALLEHERALVRDAEFARQLAALQARQDALDHAQGRATGQAPGPGPTPAVPPVS